jgi:hypothetical protein
VWKKGDGMENLRYVGERWVMAVRREILYAIEIHTMDTRDAAY